MVDLIASMQNLAGPDQGQAIIDGTFCQYAGAIKPGDLVAANFAIKEVTTGGGLYLVHEHDGEQVTWRGCRRMARVPTGIAVDLNGEGDWLTLPDLSACNWVVVGAVEKVYRATS